MSPTPGWGIPSPWGVPLALVVGPVLLAGIDGLRLSRWLRARVGSVLVVLSALVAVAAGVRLAGTGAPAFGVAGAVIVLTVVAQAVAGLVRQHRLGPGLLALGAIAVGGIAAVRAVQGLLIEAEVAAAIGLAWALLGDREARHEAPRALDLAPGYVLGVLALQAGGRTGLPAPTNLVVALCLLAVPLADAGLVCFGRTWRGHAPWARQDDHVGDRFVRLGAPPAVTVGALLAAVAVLGVLAVCLAQSWISLGAGTAVAGCFVALIVLGALGGGPRRGRRAGAGEADPGAPGAGTRWWRWGVPAGLIVVAALLIGPAAIAGLRARAPAVAGEAAAVAGVAAAGSGHFRAARADLALARADFRRAAHDLGAPWVDGGLVVPVLGDNLTAARTLVHTGRALARSGSEVASGSRLADLRLRAGALPVHRLAELAPQLRSVVRTLRAQLASLDAVRRTYLLPELGGVLDRAIRRVRVGLGDAREAADIATYVPALLGGDGARRYFVMTQDPAEARATGGFMGSWGELVATDGHLSLTRLGRTDQLNTGGSTHRVLDAPADYLARYGQFDPAYAWQDINMSPDFPTVGRIVAGLYPQSGGTPVNGVVAIDPSGLAALLRLTGPVRIPAWPVPLTAANVVRVTTFSSYVTYAGNLNERVEFLSQVARATFQALSGVRLANLAALVDDLGTATREHHLMVYSTSPAEEAFLVRQGVAGQVPPVRSDALEVTSQNAAGNKVDYFLHESLDYSITLDPQVGSSGVARSAVVTASLGVSLHNAAPATGLPVSLIGPYNPGFSPGEAREFLTVYTPLGFSNAALDGSAVSLSAGRELGRNAYSTYVDVAAGASATLDLQLAGTLRLRRGGWYELELPVQPMVNADGVRVLVRVAPGWRITAVRGARRFGARVASVTLHPQTDAKVWVRVAAG